MQQMRGRRGAAQFRGPRNAEATDETRPRACCANRCFSQHQQPALAQLQLQPPLTRRIDAANTLANILLLPGGASIRLRHHLALALRPTRLKQSVLPVCVARLLIEQLLASSPSLHVALARPPFHIALVFRIRDRRSLRLLGPSPGNSLTSPLQSRLDLSSAQLKRLDEEQLLQLPKKMLIDLLKYMDVAEEQIKPASNETLRDGKPDKRPLVKLVLNQVSLEAMTTNFTGKSCHASL